MWYNNARFYAIHPLDAFAAEERNDFCSQAVHRITELVSLIGAIKETGCNALYLGPVFESSSHGYDTVDYFHIDRRLGDNQSFKQTIQKLHFDGLKIIGDGVFNHVGRDFWAFYDLRQKKEHSAYIDWFKDVNFSNDNNYKDGFSYHGWEGHDTLVTLNRNNPEVKEHLFAAVRHMICELGFDGLRLDVAYSLEKKFLCELSAFAKSLKPDFFLLGEIIHGDYRAMIEQGKLDSITNYELSKGLWSGHNDLNYFEIAWTLDREFGENGIFAGLGTEYPAIYNFADNHDVNRAYSLLKNKDHIFLIYALLYMIPGIPSIYYGSEYCTPGVRDQWTDRALRPRWHELNKERKDLLQFIQTLTRIRERNPFLAGARYQQLALSNTEFAFCRDFHDQSLLVALNISGKSQQLELAVGNGIWKDSFYPEKSLSTTNGKLHLTLLPSSVQIWEKK